MADLLKLSETLGGLPLAVLLFLVLIGGYKKWWVWGWQLTDCEKRAADAVASALVREQEWKNIAMPSIQAAESAVAIARQRGK